MRFVGWLLDPGDREKLLKVVPPAYPKVVAHHITLQAGVEPDAPLPPESEGIVLGIADDGTGVQALVVEIGGTVRRPDGSVFHVTWSLANGRKAVESNEVVRERGWSATDTRYRVRLEPRLFP